MDQMTGRPRRQHLIRQLPPLLLLCLSQLLFVFHDTGHLHDHDEADACEICLVGGNSLFGQTDELSIIIPTHRFAGLEPQPAQPVISRRFSDYRQRAPPASL
jgi:hypothetical protein